MYYYYPQGNWGTEKLICLRSDGQGVVSPAPGYRILAMMLNCLQCWRAWFWTSLYFTETIHMGYVVESHGRGQGPITTTIILIITTMTIITHWVLPGCMPGMLQGLILVLPHILFASGSISTGLPFAEWLHLLGFSLPFLHLHLQPAPGCAPSGTSTSGRSSIPHDGML